MQLLNYVLSSALCREECTQEGCLLKICRTWSVLLLSTPQCVHVVYCYKDKQSWFDLTFFKRKVVPFQICSID